MAALAPTGLLLLRPSARGSCSSSSCPLPPPAKASSTPAELLLQRPRDHWSPRKQQPRGLTPPGWTDGPRSPEFEGYPAMLGPAVHPNRRVGVVWPSRGPVAEPAAPTTCVSLGPRAGWQDPSPATERPSPSGQYPASAGVGQGHQALSQTPARGCIACHLLRRPVRYARLIVSDSGSGRSDSERPPATGRPRRPADQPARPGPAADSLAHSRSGAAPSHCARLWTVGGTGPAPDRRLAR